MRFRSGRALTLTAFALVLGFAARSEGEAVFVSRLAWTMDDRRFGGWSGFEIAPGAGAIAGRTFAAISDRGWIVDGTLERGPSGRIVRALPSAFRRPGDRNRRPFFTRDHRDPEGLAFAPDGGVMVSYETLQRVFIYPDLAVTDPEVLPIHRDFIGLVPNRGLEALAAGPDGAVYTLPEQVLGDTPVPVYRHDGDGWQVFDHLPGPQHGFRPVGADIGPDGRFYLLERKAIEHRGVASRVRRFDLTDTGLANETRLLTTRIGTHDNLEGLAVWRDPRGRIRLTMVSDDNFDRWQQSEIVEYVVP